MHNQAKEVPLAGIIILCKRPGDSDHKVFPCHFSLIFECVEIIIPAGRITGHCQIEKRGSRVVSALASCARGPGFDPRRRRGKFVGPNTLPFVSFAGMT